jgi:hypothetical protein
MSQLGDNVLTLSDWAARLDPNGKVPSIVELLAQTNEALTDMVFVEGNLPTGHRTTVRTGLPAVTWRKLNYGVQPSKSTTVQVDDTCGMLEAYTNVDKKLADLNGNTAEFRLSEDRSFIEAMNQEMATGFIYHDTDADPEKPLGLSPRFPYDDAPNVVDFGATGNVTSLWIVCHGRETFHATFPKGSKAGITHQDLGEVTLEDAAGGLYQGYRTHYTWDIGFVLRDWRYVVRCCNIDPDTLSGTSNNIVDSVVKLIKGVNLIPNLNMGKTVMYCNKDVKTQFDVLAYNKTTPAVYMTEVGGKFTTHFMGIPIRRHDAILSTESELTSTP